MATDSTYSPLQLDGIIWEEDSIAYGCENATLVLNNQKGLLRKNYACLESGRYQTPDGKDTPWPVCTTKPTDPCEFLLSALFTGPEIILCNRFGEFCYCCS